MEPKIAETPKNPDQEKKKKKEEEDQIKSTLIYVSQLIAVASMREETSLSSDWTLWLYKVTSRVQEVIIAALTHSPIEDGGRPVVNKLPADQRGDVEAVAARLRWERVAIAVDLPGATVVVEGRGDVDFVAA